MNEVQGCSGCSTTGGRASCPVHRNELPCECAALRAKLAEAEKERAEFHAMSDVMMADKRALEKRLAEAEVEASRLRSAIKSALEPLGTGKCKCEGCACEAEIAVGILREALKA